MEPGGSEGFVERDRIAAENYVEVARAAGVSRTIYLYRELLEPLMEGLHGDLTVEHNDVFDTFGVEPTPFATAARQAMEAMPDAAQPAAP